MGGIKKMKCNYCDFKSGERSFFTKKSRKLCKKCDSLFSKERRRSKNGLVSSIYSHQKANSKKRCHPLPPYTRKELKEWLFSQKLFHELFSTWVIFDYDKDLTPSIDRKNCTKPYYFANMTVMTWEDNHKKAGDEIKKGMAGAKSKPVVQYNLKGEYITEYRSLREAGRVNNFDDGLLGKVCKGVVKTAYGYRWRYKNDK